MSAFLIAILVSVAIILSLTQIAEGAIRDFWTLHGPLNAMFRDFLVALVVLIVCALALRMSPGTATPEHTGGAVHAGRWAVWRHRLEGVSARIAPLLGAYVALEVGERLSEQWFGVPVHIGFIEGSRSVSFAVSLILNVLFLAHWLHSAFEGRKVLLTLVMAVAIIAPMVLLARTAPEWSGAMSKQPLGTPYIDPLTGELKYWGEIKLEPIPRSCPGGGRFC